MVTMRRQLISDTSMKFGGTNPKRYLTIHETGNTSPGANAAAHANLQSGRWEWATWHWTADAREAVQSYSHNLRLWHAGDGQGHGNMSSIGVEICVNSDMSRATARQNAAELAAHILTTEGIPLANMVQHNHWSGKNCPTFIRGESRWGEFVNLVRAAMGGKPGPDPKPDPKPGKQTTAQVAAAVYAGHYGNEPQRSARLRDAGYDPAVIQAEVNRRYYGGGGSSTGGSGGATGNISALADAVMRGEYGNGDERKRRLGSNYAAVQAEVNRRISGGSSSSGGSGGGRKSNAQIAREIVHGVNGRNPWGNDPQRSQKLRAAGYDPKAVQREVNKLV